MFDCRIDFLNGFLDRFEITSPAAFDFFLAEGFHHGSDVEQKMRQILIEPDEPNLFDQGVMDRFVICGSFYFHAVL